MPEIQNPELVARVRKKYGLRGQQGPGTLSPEIVPVTIVDELLSDAEDLTACFRAQEVSPGASEYGTIRLVNPVDSASLVLLDHLLISCADGTIKVEVYESSNTYSVITAVYGDFRKTGSPSAQVQWQTATGEPSGTPLISGWFGTEANEVDAEGIILPPGKAIEVTSHNANKRMLISFKWYERLFG